MSDYEGLHRKGLEMVQGHLRAAEARRVGQATAKGAVSAALTQRGLEAVQKHHEAVAGLSAPRVRTDAAEPRPSAGAAEFGRPER